MVTKTVTKKSTKKTTKKKSTKKKVDQEEIDSLYIKLKGINDAIFKFQYNKRNCDIYLGKRFEVEQELKLDTILYESFTKEEESPDGLRDVYLAFVKKGTKPKDKDWRKFRTPEDVINFGKKK